MLNLYLVPRSGKAPRPSEEAVDAALAFLTRNGLIGESTEPGEYSPGQNAGTLFHVAPDDGRLPAEMTFDALHVHTMEKPAFVPERRLAAGFPDATCTVCGDVLDGEKLTEALDRLAYFSVERFEFTCPSCRTDLGVRQVDFGQPTAVARFWFFIEGAAGSRLKPALLERLGKLLGTRLLVVPEVPQESVAASASARRRRRRR